MSKFGWSMPAGAWESALPGEDDEFCEICGCDAVQCVCPECPVCKIAGDPACVGNHAPIEFWGNEPPNGEICECVGDKLR